MSIGAPVSRSPVPDTATLRAVVAFNRKPAKAIVQLLPEHLNAACRTGPARTMTTPVVMPAPNQPGPTYLHRRPLRTRMPELRTMSSCVNSITKDWHSGVS